MESGNWAHRRKHYALRQLVSQKTGSGASAARVQLSWEKAHDGTTDRSACSIRPSAWSTSEPLALYAGIRT